MKSIEQSAAMYLRVSTEEQTTENQRRELAALARFRKLHVVQTFDETASGSSSRRPKMLELMVACRAGTVRWVLVWSLDRIGRSMVDNITRVMELDRLGVHIVSLREPWLDTSGPTRMLLLAIFSWVAEQERAQIVERTKAGMNRARARGVHCGRPPRFDAELLKRAKELQDKGLSLRKLAVRLKIPRATIARAFSVSKGGA